MKYVLVLQWPACSAQDYERMVDLENLLVDLLGVDEDVDGHDMGGGRANIFIRTDSPNSTFDAIRPLPTERDRLKDCRVAFREANGEQYSVLWPEGAAEFAT